MTSYFLQATRTDISVVMSFLEDFAGEASPLNEKIKDSAEQIKEEIFKDAKILDGAIYERSEKILDSIDNLGMVSIT